MELILDYIFGFFVSRVTRLETRTEKSKIYKRERRQVLE